MARSRRKLTTDEASFELTKHSFIREPKLNSEPRRRCGAAIMIPRYGPSYDTLRASDGPGESHMTPSTGVQILSGRSGPVNNGHNIIDQENSSEIPSV